MVDPVLSNYATQTPLTVKTANAGTAGGVIQLDLGNADIAPLTTTGYDVTFFLGQTPLTFTRISYSATPQPNGVFNVTLSTGETGPNNSTTITVASGYAGDTDHSVALAKTGPYSTGPASNTVASWWNMPASDTSTSASPDFFTNTQTSDFGALSSNTLTMPAGCTRNASICTVQGTSVLCTGTSITFNGTSQYALTSEAVGNNFDTFPASQNWSLGFDFEYSALVAGGSGTIRTFLANQKGSSSGIGFNSSGALAISLGVGTTLTILGSALGVNTKYSLRIVSIGPNPGAYSGSLNVYVNGVLYATAANSAPLYNINPTQWCFFANDASGTPTRFVGGTIDNIWFAFEDYNANEIIQQGQQTFPGIALIPRRKLVRVGSGATQGQFLTVPASGFGSPVLGVTTSAIVAGVSTSVSVASYLATQIAGIISNQSANAVFTITGSGGTETLTVSAGSGTTLTISATTNSYLAGATIAYLANGCTTSPFSVGNQYDNGFAEICPRYNAAGWNWRGSTYQWLATVTDLNNLVVGIVGFNGTPASPTGVFIDTVPLIGTSNYLPTSHSGVTGPAVTSNWYYLNGKYTFSYSTGYDVSPGDIYCVSTSDNGFTFTAQQIMVATGAIPTLPDGNSANACYNHRVEIIPATGLYGMILEVFDSGISTGVYRFIGLTQRDLSESRWLDLFQRNIDCLIRIASGCQRQLPRQPEFPRSRRQRDV